MISKEKIETVLKAAMEYEEVPSASGHSYKQEYIKLCQDALAGDDGALSRLTEEEETILGEVISDQDFGCLWT